MAYEQTSDLEVGFRLISLLLLSAKSVIDTLPLCFTNLATDSNSSCEIYINFPLSSITPETNRI